MTFAQDRPVEARAVLDRYCVTCHNEKLRAQGTVPVSLETVDLANPSASAEVLEKVIRKLRTGAMPPAGRPRPDEATYRAVVAWLETELDRAAAVRPDPGRSPALHRLSRTEYQNAIRDLLALEVLPSEMDVELLLPADNASSGFDNLADLLFVDPTLLERYLAAARKISRLAVGDPTIPMIVDTYRFPTNLPQDRHIEGLPLGTRGGTLIRSNLPVDGEYLIKIEFAGRAREPQQLEVSVDGERAQLLTAGGQERTGGVTRVGQQVFDEAEDPPLEVRLPLKAGPREVGIAYVQRTGAASEALVRPFRRGRGELPALALVSLSGPYNVAGAGETPSRRRIFICRPANPSDEPPCANAILSTLARRAYRRAVTDSDLAVLLPFYEAGRTEGGFETGIQRAIERLLVSPEFLFRIERDPSNFAPAANNAAAARMLVANIAQTTNNRAAANTVLEDVYRISDVELASRLSFFLWSSIPDDELLDAAIRGGLKDPTVLEQQVRRLLADARSAALVNNFAAQWLYLRDLEAKRPDDGLFPEFDEALRQAFRRETELFLESIMREDRPVLDLLDANYTFVNERLARHYGIPNIYGSHFRRVTLSDDSPRRGLLGKGSILTLTSLAIRTSVVLRGKWVLDNILASPPPQPPANVPALQVQKPDGKALSMRDAMVLHRANPVCSSCHARMDPLGFALENFDAVGKWRAIGIDGKPLDVSGVLPNGTKFDGPAGLREVLLSQGQEFVTSVSEKLLMYALGRNLEYYDAPAVRTIIREAARSDYRFSSLILGIVKSTPFQMRRSQS